MQCRKMAFANASFLRPSGHKKSKRTSYRRRCNHHAASTSVRRHNSAMHPLWFFVKSCPRLHAEQAAYCNTTIVRKVLINIFFIFSNLE